MGGVEGVDFGSQLEGLQSFREVQDNAGGRAGMCEAAVHVTFTVMKH